MSKTKNSNADGRHTYKWFFPLALGSLTLALFGSCIFFEHVNYDDVALTINNILTQSLAPGNLVRMFSFFCIESYYPIRLLSPVSYTNTSMVNLLKKRNFSVVFGKYLAWSMGILNWGEIQQKLGT